MMFYSGACCIAMVCVFSMVFTLPIDRNSAIGGLNFYLHVICPLGVLIAFFLVESDHNYSIKETLICLLPVLIYTIVYLVMVVFLGDRTGWVDIYQVNKILPWYLSLTILWTMAFVIAIAIKKIAHTLYKRRRQKMLASWKRDADPVEVNIEIFGLGRYYGMHGDDNDLSVPFDILKDVGEMYGMEPDQLLQVYMNGLKNGIKERQGYYK